jgi:hypothetical protein
MYLLLFHVKGNVLSTANAQFMLTTQPSRYILLPCCITQCKHFILWPHRTPTSWHTRTPEIKYPNRHPQSVTHSQGTNPLKQPRNLTFDHYSDDNEKLNEDMGHHHTRKICITTPSFGSMYFTFPFSDCENLLISYFSTFLPFFPSRPCLGPHVKPRPHYAAVCQLPRRTRHKASWLRWKFAASTSEMAFSRKIFTNEDLLVAAAAVESQLKPPEANRHVPTTYCLQKWRGFLSSGPTLVGFELASHLARFCQLIRANEDVYTSSGNATWPCQLAYSGIVWTQLYRAFNPRSTL